MATAAGAPQINTATLSRLASNARTGPGGGAAEGDSLAFRTARANEVEGVRPLPTATADQARAAPGPHGQLALPLPPTNVLIVARALAQKLGSRRPQSAAMRAELCLSLLPGRTAPDDLADFKTLITKLPEDEQHYWIGTLYTLLLPPKTRHEQAAYFTPPYLAEAVLDLAIGAGFDPAQHRVLDPAAGGAAFLSTIAARKIALGLATSSRRATTRSRRNARTASTGNSSPLLCAPFAAKKAMPPKLMPMEGVNDRHRSRREGRRMAHQPTPQFLRRGDNARRARP
jgi:hypothetical protein